MIKSSSKTKNILIIWGLRTLRNLHPLPSSNFDKYKRGQKYIQNIGYMYEDVGPSSPLPSSLPSLVKVLRNCLHMN